MANSLTQDIDGGPPPPNHLHLKTCWWRPRNAASTSAATAASADPQEVTIACPVLGESGSACSVLNIYRKKINWWKRAINCQVLYRAGMSNRKRQQDPVLCLICFFHTVQSKVWDPQSMKSIHRIWSPYTGGAPGIGRPELSALQGGQGESRVDQQSRIFSKCFLMK